jgi:NADH-quinone oxidoreductase subunit M
MKKLIAYSSVAHMAIRDRRPVRLQRAGLEGAMIVMLSHGLVSGALFLCVGVIYDRLHTREIDRYGGLAINMPATRCSSCCSPWPASACRAPAASSANS